jgi:fluoride exporter
MIVLLLVLAGGAGAATRLVIDGAVRARWTTSLPWATIVINVTGSLALGVLTGLVLRQSASPDLRMILGTGFCGGYTTFSTASFETVRLVQQGRVTGALLNGLGTAVLGVGAAAVGLLLTR